MKLTFIGAAESVTGSSHLLEANGKKILFDCGLYQGKRAEATERNRNFAFSPKDIDIVILSHAHTDHSGNIPSLVKQGFRGEIYATPATRDLAGIMLQDTALLQERDAEFVTKRHLKKGLPPVEPLYALKDAQAALDYFISVPFHKTYPIAKGIELTFYHSGHILGSAVTALDIKENGKERRVAFTGDIGRPHTPILKDPECAGDVDYLISESTYGNRLHKPKDEVERILSDILQRAYARKGKVLIPAFSVGRTQEMLYFFNQLRRAGKMPDMTIYLDSPLAQDVTSAYRYHPECFDEEMRQLIYSGEDPFKLENVAFTRSVEESKRLNELSEPCVIIAGSGMAEGGRITHHLANNIENPNATVLIVGYMAENTLGRKILEKRSPVNIFGEPMEIKAEIVAMNNFSAHADRNELLNYLSQYDPRKMKTIFLVHGEKEACESLREGLCEKGFARVEIPKRGESFELA